MQSTFPLLPILTTKYSLSSEKLTPLEKQDEKSEPSSPVEYTRKNNSYSKQEIKLFEYASKGLSNINCSVFKHYLEFVVSHTITTSSTGSYYLCICINRKDNKISQNIKELFKGCDKNYHNIFVHNINDVLHGNCIDIDEKSLKKYDEYVLSYLKMISLSKRSKEK